MSERNVLGMLVVSIVLMTTSRVASAQDDRLQKIERRLDALEQRGVSDGNAWDRFEILAVSALPILGIGLFCGLWARSSGRDFWLWFVGGLVFNLLALLVLYDAIEKDKKAKRLAAEKAAKEPLDL